MVPVASAESDDGVEGEGFEECVLEDGNLPDDAPAWMRLTDNSGLDAFVRQQVRIYGALQYIQSSRRVSSRYFRSQHAFLWIHCHEHFLHVASSILEDYFGIFSKPRALELKFIPPLTRSFLQATARAWRRPGSCAGRGSKAREAPTELEHFPGTRVAAQHLQLAVGRQQDSFSRYHRKFFICCPGATGGAFDRDAAPQLSLGSAHPPAARRQGL
jgi:hypothetical protein